MLVFLDGVADVEWFSGMNMVEVGCHVESYTIDHTAGSVVDQFEFYMLQIAAYEFARAEVFDTSGAECGLAVAGTEGIEKP